MLLAKTDRISFVFFFLAQDLILFLSWFKSSMPLLKSIKIVIEHNYLEIRVTWYLIRIYWPWIWLMSVSGLSDTSRYRLSSQNWVSNEYCRGTFTVKNKQVCQKKNQFYVKLSEGQHQNREKWWRLSILIKSRFCWALGIFSYLI